MPTVSESLNNFLHARATSANADLIEKWYIGMETQVLVSAGNGEPVAGKRNTWSDGLETWHHIRIPRCRQRAGVERLRDEVAARSSHRRNRYDRLGLAEESVSLGRLRH